MKLRQKISRLLNCWQFVVVCIHGAIMDAPARWYWRCLGPFVRAHAIDKLSPLSVCSSVWNLIEPPSSLTPKIFLESGPCAHSAFKITFLDLNAIFFRFNALSIWVRFVEHASVSGLTSLNKPIILSNTIVLVKRGFVIGTFFPARRNIT